MCLSTVFTEAKNSEPLIKNVAMVEIQGDEIIFTDILGRKTAVKGFVSAVDLMENTITVREKSV